MMRILVVAAGARAPGWVDTGFEDFAGRVRGDCSVRLRVVPLSRRSAKAVNDRVREEGEALLKAVPNGALIVALDARGEHWDTRQLAARLDEWRGLYRDVALLVGGPDGLPRTCLASAHLQWSLSRLTLPHALVRVIVAEQLYRAWSLLHGHPYHRAS